VGDGTTADRDAPVQIGSSDQWTRVSAAFSHTCGIDAGLLYCWGRDNNGQLGIGSTADRSSPTAVGTETWLDVSAGGQTSCGVTSDGALHCWGSLGVGDGERRPVRMGTATDWTAVSVGESSITGHRCALRAGGTMECAGPNGGGQLGDGTTTSRDDFAPAMGGPWDRVSAGSGYTCALAEDGGLWCFGRSDLGQTGLGSVDPVSVPTRVGTDTWRELSAGARHACAIRTDGALFCWGANDVGELGTGTPLSPEPLEVVR
jgi:alpha-tubulin suppressor-like RCC1 family protein